MEKKRILTIFLLPIIFHFSFTHYVQKNQFTLTSSLTKPKVQIKEKKQLKIIVRMNHSNFKQEAHFYLSDSIYWIKIKFFLISFLLLHLIFHVQKSILIKLNEIKKDNILKKCTFQHERTLKRDIGWNYGEKRIYLYQSKLIKVLKMKKLLNLLNIKFISWNEPLLFIEKRLQTLISFFVPRDLIFFIFQYMYVFSDMIE